LSGAASETWPGLQPSAVVLRTQRNSTQLISIMEVPVAPIRGAKKGRIKKGFQKNGDNGKKFLPCDRRRAQENKIPKRGHK